MEQNRLCQIAWGTLWTRVGDERSLEPTALDVLNRVLYLRSEFLEEMSTVYLKVICAEGSFGFIYEKDTGDDSFQGRIPALPRRRRL